jgi:hypothetical protein
MMFLHMPTRRICVCRCTIVMQAGRSPKMSYAHTTQFSKDSVQPPRMWAICLPGPYQAMLNPVGAWARAWRQPIILCALALSFAASI